jgi:hypothetical protein
VETASSANGIMNPSNSSKTNGSGGGLNLAAELNLANDFEATQKANQVDKVVQSKESQNQVYF